MQSWQGLLHACARWQAAKIRKYTKMPNLPSSFLDCRCRSHCQRFCAQGVTAAGEALVSPCRARAYLHCGTAERVPQQFGEVERNPLSFCAQICALPRPRSITFFPPADLAWALASKSPLWRTLLCTRQPNDQHGISCAQIPRTSSFERPSDNDDVQSEASSSGRGSMQPVVPWQILGPLQRMPWALVRLLFM